MDFGLILFLTSILLGNPSDNNSDESSETQDSTENNNKTTDQILSAEDTSSEDKQTDLRKQINNVPTISGTADKVVMQDDYYDFTPLSIDVENDQLEYSINNKPDWAVFDSRTGTVSGKPRNENIGTTKDIIITVFDSYGASSSLQPFSIEVINVNDQPIISGIPSLYVSLEKTFKFKPKVKDIDLDIGLDKLIFSIKNKPKWASFNPNTGELTGKPSETFIDSDAITITVTDSYGKSDSLKPFYLKTSYINASQVPKANNQTSKSATQITNNDLPASININGYGDINEESNGPESDQILESKKLEIVNDQNNLDDAGNEDISNPELSQKEGTSTLDPNSDTETKPSNPETTESVSEQETPKVAPSDPRVSEQKLEPGPEIKQEVEPVLIKEEKKPITPTTPEVDPTEPSVPTNPTRPEAAPLEPLVPEPEIKQEVEPVLINEEKKPITPTTPEVVPTEPSVPTNPTTPEAAPLEPSVPEVKPESPIQETRLEIDSLPINEIVPTHPVSPTVVPAEPALPVSDPATPKVNPSESMELPESPIQETRLEIDNPPEPLALEQKPESSEPKDKSEIQPTPTTSDSDDSVNSSNDRNDASNSGAGSNSGDSSNEGSGDSNDATGSDDEADSDDGVDSSNDTGGDSSGGSSNNGTGSDGENNSNEGDGSTHGTNSDEGDNSNNRSASSTNGTNSDEGVDSSNAAGGDSNGGSSNNATGSNEGDGSNAPVGSDKPPKLDTIENQTINEDAPEFTINLFATDIDNENGEIDYRAELNSGNMVSVAIQKDKLIITPLNNAYGKTEITIIALSNGKEDTTTFELIIEPKNDPPIITSTAPTSATEDIEYIYQAMVSDPDDTNNGNDLTWTLSNHPNGMVVSNKGVVTWTPTEGITSSDAVTLSVADGAFSSTQTFTIGVDAVNDAPTIELIDCIDEFIEDSNTNQVGQKVCSYIAEDPDNDLDIEFSQRSNTNQHYKLANDSNKVLLTEVGLKAINLGQQLDLLQLRVEEKQNNGFTASALWAESRPKIPFVVEMDDPIQFEHKTNSDRVPITGTITAKDEDNTIVKYEILDHPNIATKSIDMYGNWSVMPTKIYGDLTFTVEVTDASEFKYKYDITTQVPYNNLGKVTIKGAESLVIDDVSNFTNKTLSAVVSDDDSISEPIKFEWKRDGEVISGKDSHEYEINADNIGKEITVSATYTDEKGYEETVNDSIKISNQHFVRMVKESFIASTNDTQVRSTLTYIKKHPNYSEINETTFGEFFLIGRGENKVKMEKATSAIDEWNLIFPDIFMIPHHIPKGILTIGNEDITDEEYVAFRSFGYDMDNKKYAFGKKFYIDFEELVEFYDIDNKKIKGDSLQLTATTDDGSELPIWLEFKQLDIQGTKKYFFMGAIHKSLYIAPKISVKVVAKNIDYENSARTATVSLEIPLNGYIDLEALDLHGNKFFITDWDQYPLTPDLFGVTNPHDIKEPEKLKYTVSELKGMEFKIYNENNECENPNECEIPDWEESGVGSSITNYLSQEELEEEASEVANEEKIITFTHADIVAGKVYVIPKNTEVGEFKLSAEINSSIGLKNIKYKFDKFDSVRQIGNKIIPKWYPLTVEDLGLVDGYDVVDSSYIKYTFKDIKGLNFRVYSDPIPKEDNLLREGNGQWEDSKSQPPRDISFSYDELQKGHVYFNLVYTDNRPARISGAAPKQVHTATVKMDVRYSSYLTEYELRFSELKINNIKIDSNDVNEDQITNLKTININIDTNDWANFKQSNIQVENLFFPSHTFSCDLVDKHKCLFKVVVRDDVCKHGCTPRVYVSSPSSTIFGEFTWRYNAPTVTNDSTEELIPRVSIEDKMDKEVLSTEPTNSRQVTLKITGVSDLNLQQITIENGQIVRDMRKVGANHYEVELAADTPTESEILVKVIVKGKVGSVELGSVEWIYEPISNHNQNINTLKQFITGMDPHYGTKHNDHFIGNFVNNWLIGGAGDDTLEGNDGHDILIGQMGSDKLYGGDDIDLLQGGGGDDWLSGGADTDDLHGGKGLDEIYGDDGNDFLYGNEGDDTLDGGNGNDMLKGGEGDDTLDGGNGNDTLEGGAGNDTLDGGIGNDTLNGGQGNDWLDGGTGSNTFCFSNGDGDDAIHYFQENDSILFIKTINNVVIKEEKTQIVITYGEKDKITITRHENFDIESNIYKVESCIPTAEKNNIDFNTITGNDNDDVLIGDDDNETIEGLGGTDNLKGGGGNDTLDGGQGHDWLDGGIGDDKLKGGEGNDTLFGGDGNDLLKGGQGDDWLNGGTGSNIFCFFDGDGHDEIKDFQLSEDSLYFIGQNLVGPKVKEKDNDVVVSYGSDKENTITLKGISDAEAVKQRVFDKLNTCGLPDDEKLELNTGASEAENGKVIYPAPIIHVLNSSGKKAGNSIAVVKVSLEGTGTGASLECNETCSSLDNTINKNAEYGIATFDGLILKGYSGTYRLSFSSIGLTTIYHDIKLTGEEPTKLVITNTNSDDEKYKINISDLINTKFEEYKQKNESKPKDKRVSLIHINNSLYSDKVIFQTIKQFGTPISIHLNETMAENIKYFTQARAGITTKDTGLSTNYIVEFQPYECRLGPIVASKHGRTWTIEDEDGKQRVFYINNYNQFDIPTRESQYQIAPELMKKSEFGEYAGAKFATTKLKPVYYDCNEGEKDQFTFITPSMAIENGGTLPSIEVKLKDKDENFIKSGNYEVTVRLSDATDGKLICVEGTDHCQTARLESKQGSEIKCQKSGRYCTLEASDGVANFEGLILRGNANKIYNLEFRYGDLSYLEFEGTEKSKLKPNSTYNHKAQVYIDGGGKVSIHNSEIKVVESEVSTDGAGETIITVQLKDADNNEIRRSVESTVEISTNFGVIGETIDNEDGTYTATLTSKKVGIATITATVDDQEIEGKASVTFKADDPHKIEIDSDSDINYKDKAIVGTEVTGIPLTFKVTDKNNNPVEGIDVIFKVVSGDGNLQSKSKPEWSSKEEKVTTNNEGIATLKDIEWFLGSKIGLNELHVTFDGAPSDVQPIKFQVEGTPDKAAHIHEYTSDEYQYDKTGTVGNILTNPPKILITDQHHNPVDYQDISYTVYDTDNKSSVITAITKKDGIATLDAWTLDTRAGDNRIVAKIDSEKEVEFTVTGVADRNRLLIASSNPDNPTQTAIVGTKVETPPSVTVTDFHGNPAQKQSVTFEIVDLTNLHQNGCVLQFKKNSFYGSLKEDLYLTDSQSSFFYKTHEDKTDENTIGNKPQFSFFNTPDNFHYRSWIGLEENGDKVKDEDKHKDRSIEKIYCTTYQNKSKHVATKITTDENGKAKVHNWFVGYKVGAKYQLKAYINKGDTNQRFITFFATATASLNHTKRISVTEITENGGIEIVKDLDANYQAKLSRIEIDQIHDTYGNKIYDKDIDDIEPPTGEFKIDISVKDDESKNNPFECDVGSNNTCKADNNKVTLTFTQDDVENKKLNFEDVLFTGEYNKEYEILFKIEGIKRKPQEFNLDPTLKINETKNKLTLNEKEIDVRNEALFNSSLIIEAKDGTDKVVGIKIEIEEEEGTLSCDDNNYCTQDGKSVTIYPSDGIFTLEKMGIQGKVGQTYTLKFTSEGLISTTHKVKITEAGDPAKLSIKQQPSVTAKNGLPLEVQPIIQLLDGDDNPVKKLDIKVSVKAVKCSDENFDSEDCKRSQVEPITLQTARTGNIGEATFKGLSIQGVPGVYKLIFSVDSLEKLEPVYGKIKLSAGPATQLKLTQAPSNTATNTEPLEQQPIVQIVDSFGNPVKQSGITIEVELGLEPENEEETNDLLNLATMCTGILSKDRNNASNKDICTEINNEYYKLTSIDNYSAITNKNGIATFEDLLIIGDINKSYQLKFKAKSEGIETISSTIKIDTTSEPKFVLSDSYNYETGVESEGQITLYALLGDAGGNVLNKNGYELKAFISDETDETDETKAKATGTFHDLHDKSFKSDDFKVEGPIGIYKIKFTALKDSSKIALIGSRDIEIITGGTPFELKFEKQPPSPIDNEKLFSTEIQLLDKYKNPLEGELVKVGLTPVTCNSEDSSSISCHYSQLKGEISVKTDKEGQAKFEDLHFRGQIGTYSLDFTVDDSPLNYSKKVILKAGSAKKMIILLNNTATYNTAIINKTNGETIEEELVVQLVDGDSNPVKRDNVTITAKLGFNFDYEHCMDRFGCTKPILKGIKQIKTDQNGQAKFTDLSVSGKKGKHKLKFTATVDDIDIEYHLTINIDKASKPTQINVYQDQKKNGFASESALSHVEVQIQDSGGNNVDSNMLEESELEIYLKDAATAELGCAVSENHGCVPYGNGKKITIPIDQPTTTLDTVILAGEIATHKLEFKAEFSNTDYAIDEQNFKIDHPGKMTDIFIIDPITKEEIKEYHDIVEVKQMSHCNPLKGGNYTFKDKYKNTIKNTFTGDTLWQREHKEELYAETLFFDVNTEGESKSEGVYKSDDSMIWSEPENKNQPGDIGRYRASVDGKNITICTYNFYLKKPKETITLKWPMEKQFSESISKQIQESQITSLYDTNSNINNDQTLEQSDSDLLLQLQTSSLKYLKISDDKTMFTYKITDDLERHPIQQLESFDEFSFDILDKKSNKHAETSYDVVIKLDPSYSKQWYMSDKDHEHQILWQKDKIKNTNKNIDIVILGDNFDPVHSDLVNIKTDNSITSVNRTYYKNINISETYNNVSLAGILGATGWNYKGIIGIADDMSITSVRVTDRIIKVTEDAYFRTEVDQNDEIKAIEEYFNDDNTTIFTLAYDLSARDTSPINEKLNKLVSKENAIFVRGAGDGLINYYAGDDDNGKCISGPDQLKNICPDYDQYCKVNFGNNIKLTCQSSATDPRANHPAMINVASINDADPKVSSSARGPNIWIGAPGVNLTTICKNGKSCDAYKITESFSGSNGAAAFTSGIIALMQQKASNGLTSRDVKYILAQTAEPIDGSGSTNSAGYVYSESFGFGAIDIRSALEIAKTHEKNYLGSPEPFKGHSNIVQKEFDINISPATFTSEINMDNDDNFIESIIVKSRFKKECGYFWWTCETHRYGFRYSIILESPKGTKATLLTPYSKIRLNFRDHDLDILTNAFYGEKIKGKWKLYIQSHVFDANKFPYYSEYSITGWDINFIGTKTDISKNP